MADTTYVDASTLLTADTMNDLNRLHYTILSDPADAAAVRTALALTALATTTPGTGVATALAVNVGSAGAAVVNGGALGTPSSGNLANCTGYPSTGITLDTPQASTSGTAIDFTSIPAGTKRITISFFGVSTSGSSQILIQLGDAGGVETSGYLGSAYDSSVGTAQWGTTGASVCYNTGASYVYHGAATLVLENSSSNKWIITGAFARSDAAVFNASSGSKATSATLDRVRVTTVNGTDTFDAGEINIAYE